MRAELSLLALSLAISSPVLASPRLVRAAVDACAEGPLPAEALARLLPLELESAGLRLSQTSTAPELILTIHAFHCSPERAEVTLAALELKSGRGTSRTISLESGPAGPRIAAVAIAELARDLIARPEPAGSPAAQPGPTTKTSTPAALPPRLPALRLGLGLGVAAYPGASAALLAADLGLLCPLDAGWSLEFGATLRYGAEQDLRGAIDLAALAPAVGIHLEQRLGSVELWAGPRLVLGWAFAAGRPRSQAFVGKRVDGVLGELWLDAGVSFTIAPRWSLGARGSAGYVLSGLTAQAEGNDLTGIEGAALGFSLFLARDI